MSVVIPTSQLKLMRKRKQLQKMIDDGEWEQLSGIEYELYQEINAAVEDPQRASRELLLELGSVITMYKNLTALCHHHGSLSSS